MEMSLYNFLWSYDLVSEKREAQCFYIITAVLFVEAVKVPSQKTIKSYDPVFFTNM